MRSSDGVAFAAYGAFVELFVSADVSISTAFIGFGTGVFLVYGLDEIFDHVVIGDENE